MMDPRVYITTRKAHIRGVLIAQFSEYAATLPPRINQAIAKYVSPTRTPEATWSSSDTLQSRTFGLRNALLGGGSGAVQSSHASASGVEATGGIDPGIIKYAMIHEHGGFIRSHGNMHKYFWAMFYATKLPWYRIMALSIKKIGGVNIKKRSFVGPGIKDAIEQAQRLMPNEIARIIHRAWSSG